MTINDLVLVLAGPKIVGPHPAPDETIPVHLTLPGYRFTRSGGVTVEEFSRHYLHWFVARRFQTIGCIENICSEMESCQAPPA